MRLGGWEIILVFLVVLLIFGPKKLPSLGKSFAEFLQHFKKGVKDVQEETKSIDSSIKKEVKG